MAANTPAALLYSRLAYLNLHLAACSFLGALALFSLIPALRHALRSRALGPVTGALSCVAGLVFSADLGVAVRLAALCFQCAACGVLLAAWSLRLRKHSAQVVLVACCAAPCVAAAFQVLLIGTANAFGLLGNTNNFTVFALRTLSFTPLACGIFLSASLKRAGSTEAPAQPSLSPNPLPPALSATSAIVLCVALFSCNFLSGATFSPYLYDFVWIITVGLLVAALPCLAGAVVFSCIDARACAAGSVWALTAALAFTVCSLAAFAFSAGPATALGIALIFASSHLLGALLIALACMRTRSQLSTLRYLAAALAGSGYLYACALGIHVKQQIGYSVSGLTPFVIVAVTTLAVLYFLQSALQAAHSKGDGTDGPDGADEAPEERVDLERAHYSEIGEQMDARRLAVLKQLGLTPRECDVVLGMLRGQTYTDISESLSISKKTVSYHLSNVYRKLDAPGKQGVAALVDSIIRSDEQSERESEATRAQEGGEHRHGGEGGTHEA